MGASAKPERSTGRARSAAKSPPLPAPGYDRPDVRAVGQKKAKRAPSKAVPPTPRVTLCLTLGPERIGLALGAKVALGPLSLDEAEVRLPNLSFPLDVSGGVNRFRHRRGELVRLRLSVGFEALVAWMAPRLADVVVPGVPRIRLARAREASILVEIAEAPATRRSPEEPAALAWTRPKAALAFEVAIGLEDDDVTLVVGEARGAGLAAPATRLAMEAVAKALGPAFRFDGAALSARNIGRAIGAFVFPEAGARAPRVGTIGAAGIALDVRGLEVTFREGRGFVGDAGFVRAREGARLTARADEQLQHGDLEGAREALVDALVTAPRHPDVARRLVELDAGAEGRTEAALSILRDAEHASALRLGDLPSALHLRAADATTAVARAIRDAEREPAPTVRALLRTRAAALTSDPIAALRELDEARIDAQAYGFTHYISLDRALEAGRFEDAEASLGLLEALVAVPDDKSAVLVACGALFVGRGHPARARDAFERALRYVPDDPAALLGLGEALVASGHAARGASVLLRAAEVARSVDDGARAGLALARCLLDHLDDPAAAIARAASVPSGLASTPEARSFEARARLLVGDREGAKIAFAKLRDEPLDEQHLPLLLDAAITERDVLGDLAAAQRSARRARALAPLSAAVLELERTFDDATVVATPVAVHVPRASETALAANDVAPPAEPEPRSAHAAFDPSALAPDEIEARVEQRIAELRADPTRDDVVDELVVLLGHLDRGLELLALLSARLEDAPAERRASLVPHQRAVLARLEEVARAAGRDDEAALYAMSREMLA